MQWTITHNKIDNFLAVKSFGILTEESSKQMRDETFAELKRHNCSNCLLDYSKIVSDERTLSEFYALPEKYKSHGLPQTFKLAIIVNDIIKAGFYFIETVCYENGLDVKAFEDEESAMFWLCNHITNTKETT